MSNLWDAIAVERTASDPEFTVDVAGYEGPLDLLLTMARNQKVDLSKISILDLARQYLSFVEQARKLRLELAADYLVMAAWLAYLKSRLLLPDDAEEDEPSGEELAALLSFRLQRLNAMREASARLMGRQQLGRDVFARGAPEPVVVNRSKRFDASLHDLLSAYVTRRQVDVSSNVTIEPRSVWSLAEARDILFSMLGRLDDWTRLDSFLVDYLVDREERPGVIAASFAASLEMVREGSLEMRQAGNFAPLHLRRTGVAAGAPQSLE
ncbi:MAG: ScpA family protein [Ahrensia sp.]|nr:ScpA family protein [Ahrensia sp.]